MTKAELRKIFLERRLLLSRGEFWDLMDGILNEVRKVNFEEMHSAHVFLPIASKKEIDTFSIIDLLKTEHPGIQLNVPKTDFVTHSLVPVHFDHELTILRRNKWGIPEPVFGLVVDPWQIDLVFVPLLAADTSGARVGYGKGFYDRFLKGCRPDALKVGLSFFEPYSGHITDVSDFDVPLDLCIWPQGTLDFRKN